MTATYNTVYFTPDPFVGTRFCVAALLETGGGRVAITADVLPEAACVGGEGARRLLQIHLNKLQAEPLSLGPHLTISEPRSIPQGVGHPEAWLRRFALPARAHDDGVRHPRGRQRSTRGFAFFVQIGVSARVQRGFEPATDAGGLLREYARTLPSITHWSDPATRLVLMEPVLPDRPQLVEDLQQVTTAFRAYRDVAREVGLGRDAISMISYIMPGGTDDVRRELRHDLERVSRVCDTLNMEDRLMMRNMLLAA